MATWIVSLEKRLRIVRALAVARGADDAPYTPNDTLSEKALAAFEKKHGVALPEDYRAVLAEVGNGGFGPDYDLLPLAPFTPAAMPTVTATVTSKDGKVTGRAGTPKRPRLRRPAEIKRPFSLAEGWFPRDPLPVGDGHPYDGCIELAEIGCGYSCLLVVTGPRRGEVWHDTTAADGPIAPTGLDFRGWIDRWLDGAIAWGARGLALGLAEVERRAPAIAALKAASPYVTEATTRDAALAACRAHVALALGDEATARAIVPTLGAEEAALLRSRIHARAIAEARANAPSAALARHEAREVRLALAANPRIAPRLVATLSKDADLEVRALAARHPKADPKVVAGIAAEALGALARGDLGLELAMLVELALRNDGATAKVVGAAIDSAEGHDHRLAAVVLRGAALARAATEEHRTRLAASRWPEVRHGVALNRAATSALLVRLASDDDRTVRVAVASRRDLDVALLRKLADDVDPEVRGAVAGNPRTPAKVMVSLARCDDCHFQLRNNPSLPDALVKAFELLAESDHDDREVDAEDVPRPRAWVLPADVDGVPADAPAADVVAAKKVRHWSFPVAALGAHFDAHMASYEMAGRPWLDAPLFERLAADGYAYTRARIAERADTPALIVERLARDPSEIVRRDAAANPRLSVATVIGLLRDDVDVVREAATMTPTLPPEHLPAMAKNRAAYTRRGVARSPHVPSALLDALANDKDEVVRWWVAWAPAASKKTLDRLAKDKDAQTRGRVAFRRAVEALRG